MADVLSTFRTKYLDRATVLKAVLDAQGPLLFSQILQERAVQAKPKPAEPRAYLKILKEFRATPWVNHLSTLALRAEQTRVFVTEKIVEGAMRTIGRIQTSDDKKNEVLSLLAQSFSTYGGVIIGLNLPNVDVRFFSSDSPDQTVVFHSAPRLFTEVALEWAAKVLRLVASSESLSKEDRDFFLTLERVFEGGLAGVTAGTSVRDEIWKSIPGLRKLLHSEQPLPVDSQSLKMASLWVQQMLRQAAAKAQANSTPSATEGA